MWSDDEEALHEIARKIGMRREWFQDRPGFPHYDLVPTRRAAALRAGAVERSLRDWIKEKMERAKRISSGVKCPRCRVGDQVEPAATTNHPGVFCCRRCQHQFCA